MELERDEQVQQEQLKERARKKRSKRTPRLHVPSQSLATRSPDHLLCLALHCSTVCARRSTRLAAIQEVVIAGKQIEIRMHSMELSTIFTFLF